MLTWIGNAWLNRFADRSLTDRQRLALVYLRYNEQLTNSDYQRLNHVDSVTANRELRGLVQSGLVEQHSTRRWAYYTLSLAAKTVTGPMPLSDEERIIAYLREHGSINNAECREFLQVDIQRASNLLRKMHKQGILKREGERRWAYYSLR